MLRLLPDLQDETLIGNDVEKEGKSEGGKKQRQKVEAAPYSPTLSVSLIDFGKAKDLLLLPNSPLLAGCDVKEVSSSLPSSTSSPSPSPFISTPTSSIAFYGDDGKTRYNLKFN